RSSQFVIWRVSISSRKRACQLFPCMVCVASTGRGSLIWRGIHLLGRGGDMSASAFPCELILGGQKSGKSARAERLAAQWAAQAPGRHCVMLATGLAFDDEMRIRIARHQSDRVKRVPEMGTLEEPYLLSTALGKHSAADTLIVVDCLTMWLTNWLMPVGSAPQGWPDEQAAFLHVLSCHPGTIVLVSNEIALGVGRLQPDVRRFVHA